MNFRTAYIGNGKTPIYPMILILPILKKHRSIFNLNDSKKKIKNQKMIDEREEKNLLEFASSEDENNILIENDYESLYTDICKENFFLIFFKVKLNFEFLFLSLDL